jgi:hypothetical protein
MYVVLIIASCLTLVFVEILIHAQLHMEIWNHMERRF